MIRQAFRVERMSRKQVFEYIIPNSPRFKKVRKVKNKVKSIPIIFFDVKKIGHKEFVLVGQTVNSPYYLDVVWATA